MKYCEIVEYDHGIFEYISHTFPGQNSVDLDMMFYGLYSQRELAPMAEIVYENKGGGEDGLRALGELVAKFMEKQWDDIDRVLGLEYDPTILYRADTKETTSRKEGMTSESSRLDQNRVYGFDATTAPVDDSEGENTETGKRENTDDFTRDMSVTGNNGRLKSTQDLIKQELEIRSKNLVRQWLADVACTILLPIY